MVLTVEFRYYILQIKYRLDVGGFHFVLRLVEVDEVVAEIVVGLRLVEVDEVVAEIVVGLRHVEVEEVVAELVD
jgi:hypothetical protein